MAEMVTPGASMGRQPRRLLYVAAALALIAAATHLRGIPEQVTEWWSYGLCFLMVALAQEVYVIVLLRTPTAAVLRTRSSAPWPSSLCGWARGRSASPFSPLAGGIEAMGAIAVTAELAESLLVIVLGVLPRTIQPPRWTRTAGLRRASMANGPGGRYRQRVGRGDPDQRLHRRRRLQRATPASPRSAFQGRVLVTPSGMKRAGDRPEVTMSGHRGEQTWRRPWPLLGLLLVALFLGHDALMASEALAAPHRLTGLRHHAAPLHTLPTGTFGPYGLTPESEHPELCGVGQPALTPSGGDGCGSGQAQPVAAVVRTLGHVSASPAGRFVWTEPHWPPGRRRALCQVYRL